MNVVSLNAMRATRSCSKCGDDHEAPGRYCRSCRAAYMRSWRKTHPMLSGQVLRDAARHIAYKARLAGKITQEPCCICGDVQSEMHHPDHELPHHIVWLCRECHLDWHSFWRAAAGEMWEIWQEERSKAISRETTDDAEKLAADVLAEFLGANV